MIFVKDSSGFFSIVGTDYQVLGLWNQTHKKTCN